MQFESQWSLVKSNPRWMDEVKFMIDMFDEKDEFRDGG